MREWNVLGGTQADRVTVNMLVIITEYNTISFADSTSPESVTSEPMSVHDIEPLPARNIEEDTVRIPGV